MELTLAPDFRSLFLEYFFLSIDTNLTEIHGMVIMTTSENWNDHVLYFPPGKFFFYRIRHSRISLWAKFLTIERSSLGVLIIEKS